MFLHDDDLGTIQARRILLMWLATEGSLAKPLFVYFHTVEPHGPYAPKGESLRFAESTPGTLVPSAYSPGKFLAENRAGDPVNVGHLRALYDGEVLDSDREFGAFLEILRYLGRYDSSLVAFTSDHGEEFGEHGARKEIGNDVGDTPRRVPL